MKDMKLKPMAVTFIVCLALLIGGGFTYQYVAQEKPLQQSLEQAQFSNIQLSGNKNEGYIVTLDVIDGNTLALAAEEARNILSDYKIDPVSYTIQLKQESTSLEKVWQDHLFEIAEIMANKNYSKLPELMHSIEASHEHVEASASMDQQNVYISLVADNQRFDQILPLDGGTMGVWNNEE